MPMVSTDDAILDDGLQLALYCCYELHYQGLPGVHDEWEWELTILELRRELERAFERQLGRHFQMTGARVQAMCRRHCGNWVEEGSSRYPVGYSSTEAGSMQKRSPSTGLATS